MSAALAEGLGCGPSAETDQQANTDLNRH